MFTSLVGIPPHNFFAIIRIKTKLIIKTKIITTKMIKTKMCAYLSSFCFFPSSRQACKALTRIKESHTQDVNAYKTR